MNIRHVMRHLVLLGILATLSDVQAAAFDLTAKVRAAGAATVDLKQGEYYDETAYPIDNAFNGDTEPASAEGRVLVKTNPSEAEPVIITYDIADSFTGPTEVSSVKLIIAGDGYGVGRAPKFYALQASEDGATGWTTLVEVTAENVASFAAWSTSTRTRTHDVPMTKRHPYRHYRFVCTANNGSDDSVRFSFTELVFSGISYHILAPGGVGDVVALTNALRELKTDYTDDTRHGISVFLEPGLYDLRGVYMSSTSHLVFPQMRAGTIAGLGKGPEDTILLGGGKTGGHRVMALGGASNWYFTTVSNLTVTGGYTTGYGGGILVDTDTGSATFRSCIVSNNTANLGGGCFRGRIYDTLIAENTATGSGGGAYVYARCGQQSYDSAIQGAWRTTFRGNVSGSNGGGLFAHGKCVDCTFTGNVAPNGGGLYLSTEAVSVPCEVTHGIFVGNDGHGWGHGAALHARDGIPVSNCVFAANFRSLNAGNSGNGVLYLGNYFDCIITNNSLSGPCFENCNFTRCLVARNASEGQNTVDVVDASLKGAYTNVNCLFVANTNGYAHITINKCILNCTYVDNMSTAGANYGGLTRNCRIWNSLLARNMIGWYGLDVRANYVGSTAELVMTNCVFNTSDVPVDYTGLKDCKLVPDAKFRETATGGPYDIAGSSPARDAALLEEWMKPDLGTTDFAGRPRFMFDGLDVGALECQYLPGLLLIVK